MKVIAPIKVALPLLLKERYPESPVAVGSKHGSFSGGHPEMDLQQHNMVKHFMTPLVELVLDELGIAYDETCDGLPTLGSILSGLACNHLCPSKQDLVSSYYEADSWGGGGPARNVTGREFHYGQAVWIHDGGDTLHQIVGKGILTALSLEKIYIQAEEDYWFVYSGAQPFVQFIETINGNTTVNKLRLCEPIAPGDMRKSVDQIRAERQQATAEDRRPLHLFQEREALVLQARLMGKDSRWLLREEHLWRALLEQVCADNRLSFTAHPWVASPLSEAADQMLEVWKDYVASS